MANAGNLSSGEPAELLLEGRGEGENGGVEGTVGLFDMAACPG